jgi:hypothetical protein
MYNRHNGTTWESETQTRVWNSDGCSGGGSEGPSAAGVPRGPHASGGPPDLPGGVAALDWLAHIFGNGSAWLG